MSQKFGTHKKKVLFIHPDLRGGGAEKVLVNLLNSLPKDDFDYTLLTFFQEGVNKEFLSNEITHYYVFKKVFRGWSKLQKVFSQRFLFRRLVKKDYDVIIGYLEGVPTRLLGGSNNPKTKLIAWVHVDLTDFQIEKVFRSKEEMKNTYKRLDAVVGVSHRALNSIKKLIEIPVKKLHVIHNVVDTDYIINRGVEPVDDVTFSDEMINLCSVGRLTHQKGYERLINALEHLKQNNIKFHLFLLGKGELEEELVQQVSKLSLEENVTFLGFQNNPHKYVQKCDLFVCSSYQEGFSTAVTESVLLGTPVITTDCAGMEEILDNGKVGMIVENSETALKEGLQKIVSDKSLYKKYLSETQAKSLVFQNKDNAKSVTDLLTNLLEN
ncbi:MAG: glycosyltransferase [Bacteroidota bacterium]